MELIGFFKALVMLAFVAAGGLVLLKWLAVALCLGCALIAFLLLRRTPVAATPACLLLLLTGFGIALIPVPGRSDFHGASGREASMAQRDLAREICETELAALPESILVDSLVDEVTALDEHSLINLLVQRKLDFVEIRLHRKPGMPTSVMRPRNHYEMPWPVDAGDADYVKLALASEGAADCLPPSTLPEDLKSYLSAWPLPVGMCLQARFAGRASARFVLDQRPDPRPDHPVWGHYRLIDSTTDRSIAQLTSAETPGRPALGRISVLGRGFERPDCLTPHAALADRLMGEGATSATRDGLH